MATIKREYGESDADYTARVARIEGVRGGVKKLLGYAALALAAIVALFMQPFTYENIDAGNVGIKINLYGTDRGVDNVTLVTGRVWYNSWTTKVVEFPTYEQIVDYDAFSVTAKDNAVFQIDPKLNFAINEKLVPLIYKKYRKPLPELQATIIRNQVFNAYRNVASTYSSDSLMTFRSAFEAAVETSLSEALAVDGFISPKLTSGITPPDGMSRIIEEKNASIQSRLSAENRAKQAESEAKVEIAKAEGVAKSMLIKARAEAEANELKQRTMAPNIIQMEWIKKWDGKLPETSLGGNSMPAIFSINK